MNIDRGKESFTPEEELELQAKLRDFKEVNGFSWSRLGQLTGIPFSTLSLYATGKYNNGKPAPEQAAKLNRFFLQAATQEELDRDAPLVPGFQPTKTARRILGSLAWAHRGKLVVIVGDPGTGKTAAVDQYVGSGTNVWKATMSPSTASVNATLLTVLRAMGAARVGGAGHMLAGMVRERVLNRHALLIIDEAQHLSESALEELRAIHDETKCGLVLVGNREVLTRVEGASRQAAFAQLYSRISVRLIIGKPELDDIQTLLAAWEIADEKERAFLTGIALRPGGGGVRSLTNTLEYATIMAQDDQESVRVLDHLKDAWVALSTRNATA